MATQLGAKFEITATDKTQAAFNSVKGSLKNLEKSVGSIGNMIGMGGLLSIGGGIGAVTTAIGFLIKKQDEYEQASNELNAEVRATGDAVGYSTDQLQKMAHGFEYASKYSYTQIEQLQTVIMGFTNVTGEQFKEATQFAMDYATVMNENLTEAGRQVGEALNDPIKGMRTLRTMGVSLTAQQQQQIISFVALGETAKAQQVELDALKHSYSGLAEAAANTDLGTATQEWHKFWDWVTGNSGTDIGSKLDDAEKQLAQYKKDLAEASSSYMAASGEDDTSGLQAKIKAQEDYIKTLKAAQEAQNHPDNKTPIVTSAQISSVTKLSESLKEQANTFGMTKQQAMEYRLTQGDLAATITAMGEAGKKAATSIMEYEKTLAADEAKKAATDKAKQFTKSVEDEITTLKEETATFGMNNQQKMQWLTSVGKYKDATAQEKQELIAEAAAEDKNTAAKEAATKATEAAAAAKKKDTDESKAIIEANETQKQKTDALIQSLEHLKGTTVDGVTITQQMIDKYAEMGKSAKTNTDSMSEFTKQAAHNMQDSMAQFFDSVGQKGMTLRSILHDLFSSIEKDAANMLSQLIMNSAMNSAAGSSTSWIASLGAMMGGSASGGAHAAGGTAPGNKISLVGEEGPELMIPHGDMDVIPNNQLSRMGGSTHNSVNIDARGAGPDETAKLLAMRNDILQTMMGQTEMRLQRGNWMTQS